MTVVLENMENGASEQSDWLSVLIEQCPAEPSYVNAPDSWREFGVGDGLDAVDANFEDAALPGPVPELPSQDPACLEGLDLPGLDDLLWEDAVCNDFGVQPTSSASTHQSEQCKLANCRDCVSARPGQVFSNWSAPAPWTDSVSHKQLQQQHQEVDSAPAASSPALQLPTPPQAAPQAGRVPDARQEPSSSRDSCHNEACSPQSSCDLPESGHKRRRGADSSPERAGGAQAAQASSPSDAAAASQGPQGGSRAGSAEDEPSEERKRQARMARNRESAQQSRARKKMQVDELERRNAELQAHNAHLSGMVAGLAAENAALRHQLALVQGPAQPPPNGAVPPQQQRQAAPLPLAVPPPGMAVLPPPSGIPGMPYMQWLPGMPYVGPTPKLPIQRLKPSAPAAPKKAAAAAAFAAKGGDASRKRARAAAGGTALLALFSFLVFMGPVPMWPGGSPTGGVPARLGASDIPYAALPAPLHAGGRVLQSLDADWESSGNESRGALLAAGSSVVDLNSSGWGAEGGNATDGNAFALRPRGDAGAKASALQRLKDLAPATLYADWGDRGGGVASAWAHAPGAGPRGGGQHPLLPPMQCREVFSLDAAPGIDVGAARRQLQAYLPGPGSFRGQGALAGPLALPPVAHSLPPAGTEPTKGKGTYKAKIGAADEEEEVVVSIMLPAAAQQGGSGQNRSFTSLDEVFVVVVKPLKRYVTYACSLSTPILV